MNLECSLADRVAAMLQRELKTDSLLAMNAELSGVAGWDSLKRMEMVFLFEEEFVVRFEPEEIASFQTPGDIIRSIEKAKHRGA